MPNHPVPLPVPVPRSPDCHTPYISQATSGTVKCRNINVGSASVTTCEFPSITDLYLNPVHPLPSVTFPASALIPMARRSGLSAVVAAYDAGLSVPVVRS